MPGCIFLFPVDDLAQGRMVCDVLADYDNFHVDNDIREDFSNSGGILVFSETLEDEQDGWLDAEDENGDPAWPVEDSESPS